jgi:serine protease Do
MSTRTRTVAWFFTVALAAMLLGSLVTSQVQRSSTAEARAAEPTAAAPAPAAALPGASLGLDTFRDIARRYNPGVVNINTTAVLSRRRTPDPFFEFFGIEPGPQRQRVTNLGSGFVVDKDGYILTNRHVIDEADKIDVTFPGGKSYKAKLVGKDSRTDVALLKIEPQSPLTVLALGDSASAEVGEWVMAIGSPFGYGNSVTVGVVSYVGRPIDLASRSTAIDMIQTDAAINPGNSGGPLLNTRGEVIGINTLIATEGIRQSAGVGFAVPINTARDILPQLREKGKVVRGWLGVTVGALTEDLARTYKIAEAKGAVVNEVFSGSPADKAGLQPEDVITAADDRPVEDHSALTRYISSRTPGTTVRLRVIRSGGEKTVSVTLGTFPDEAEPSEAERGESNLGMTYRDLSPELAERMDLPRGARGVVVREVDPGEAADDAGLQSGDVILSVNGERVASVADFEREIARARPDGAARLRILRRGTHAILVLRLS